MYFLHNLYYVIVFLCFVERSIASSPPSSADTAMHVGYKENGSMSLSYNTEHNIKIDDHPSMTMDSQILPGLTCHANSTRCTNKFKEYVSTQQEKHKCSTCDKCFTRKYSLKLHMRLHTGDTPYKCSTCDKCFTQKSSLKLHLHLHTGEKPYKCSTCEKCFKQKRHLDDHLRLHTGEKPYKCSTCGKCFRRTSSLMDHMRIHSGDKSYKCSTCDKCFTLRSSLYHHLRVHTEKP